jgi:hypothetical protein
MSRTSRPPTATLRRTSSCSSSGRRRRRGTTSPAVAGRARAEEESRCTSLRRARCRAPGPRRRRGEGSPALPAGWLVGTTSDSLPVRSISSAGHRAARFAEPAGTVIGQHSRSAVRSARLWLLERDGPGRKVDRGPPGGSPSCASATTTHTGRQEALLGDDSCAEDKEPSAG